jgi:hypothetical protein
MLLPRNEVVRESVSGESSVKPPGFCFLVIQKGVRHVEVAYGRYCACNRNATCFGADYGPSGRRPSHRAERTKLGHWDSGSARQQERSGGKVFTGNYRLGHERPESCGSPARLVQDSRATWKQEWPSGKAPLWSKEGNTDHRCRKLLSVHNVGDSEIIINTASIAFVSAREKD